jgi:hypothetical protein
MMRLLADYGIVAVAEDPLYLCVRESYRLTKIVQERASVEIEMTERHIGVALDLVPQKHQVVCHGLSGIGNPKAEQLGSHCSSSSIGSISRRLLMPRRLASLSKRRIDAEYFLVVSVLYFPSAGNASLSHARNNEACFWISSSSVIPGSLQFNHIVTGRQLARKNLDLWQHDDGQLWRGSSFFPWRGDTRRRTHHFIHCLIDSSQASTRFSVTKPPPAPGGEGKERRRRQRSGSRRIGRDLEHAAPHQPEGSGGNHQRTNSRHNPQARFLGTLLAHCLVCLPAR